MKVSIIIPALNEENYLPKLLGSIKKQTFKDYEVIVADAHSKDRTREIARKFGAKIVDGGRPANGRNIGAKAASGEFLFFFDSDVKLPSTFLKRAYEEMKKRSLELATCEFRPLSNLAIDKVLHRIANIIVKMKQYSSKPLASGCCILVSKRSFMRVKGFDETLWIAEDHDFVEKSVQFSPLRVLHSTYISISVRRLRKEGRIVLASKYIKSEMYRAFIGKIKKEIFKYDFGSYGKKNEESKLHKLESQLISLDRKYTRFAKKYLFREKHVGKHKRTINDFGKKLKNLLKGTGK